MSAGAIGLSALEYIAVDLLESYNPTSPKRSIVWTAPSGSPLPGLIGPSPLGAKSTLYPQVVVEERHFDELRSTDHPVEQGAATTDHAYKIPPRVTVRGGWAFGSNTTSSATSSFASSLLGSTLNSVLSIIPKATDASQLKSVYQTLLGIQNNRSLVTLVTGKRNYSNLLLETLEVTTDQHTENVLRFTAEFKTLLFATTQTTTVPSASVMQNPASNAAPTNMGQTSLLPGTSVNPGAANSVLSLNPNGPSPLPSTGTGGLY